MLYGTVTFSGALVIFKLFVLPKAVLGGSNISNVSKDCDVSDDLTHTRQFHFCTAFIVMLLIYIT